LRRPEEEQVRREPAPQFPLEGVIGPGLMERRQELADAGAIEADRAVPHDLLEGGGLLGDEAGSRAGNELTITDWDPVSKQPHLKFAAVWVMKS
jgi:hypothetical protein